MFRACQASVVSLIRVIGQSPFPSATQVISLAGDTLFDLLVGDFSKFSTFDLEHKSSDLIFVRHKGTRRHALDPVALRWKCCRR